VEIKCTGNVQCSVHDAVTLRGNVRSFVRSFVRSLFIVHCGKGNFGNLKFEIEERENYSKAL